MSRTRPPSRPPGRPAPPRPDARPDARPGGRTEARKGEPAPRPPRGESPAAPRPDDQGRRRPRAGGGGGGNPALLFGLHPVAAAWTNPERRVRKLLATPPGVEALAPAMAEAARLGLSRPAPIQVDRAELDRLLPGAVHQGLVLDAAPLPELDVADLCRAAEARARDVVVLLDQVTDPHNVGAILRSAAAFGASAVVLPDRNAPEVTGTLAKSASGAVEVVPLVRVVNLARAMGELREAGYWCVGLDESGARGLAEVGVRDRVALVLGAEGSGLRRLTMERCDEVVRLPTRGPIGSLNVSNAAAVALYELVRAG